MNAYVDDFTGAKKLPQKSKNENLKLQSQHRKAETNIRAQKNGSFDLMLGSINNDQ